MSAMKAGAEKLFPTADQTVGPYYAIGMSYPGMESVVAPGTAGAITLSGYVYDGAGNPVTDALVEIWGADASGAISTDIGNIVRKPGGFGGFGRAGSDDEGWYGLTTVLPASPDGKAAFFAVTVFARGLLSRLHTRIYVPGPGLDADPLLSRLTPERRATLIATEVPGGLSHDIHLQGEKETVFLAFN